MCVYTYIYISLYLYIQMNLQMWLFQTGIFFNQVIFLNYVFFKWLPLYTFIEHMVLLWLLNPVTASDSYSANWHVIFITRCIIRAQLAHRHIQQRFMFFSNHRYRQANICLCVEISIINCWMPGLFSLNHYCEKWKCLFYLKDCT